MTNIKTEFMALDKNLSRACSELQASEDDIRYIIADLEDEELVGLFMDLEDEISRYSEIDTLRDKIKKRLGINA